MDKIKKILKKSCIPNWVLLFFVIVFAVLTMFGWKITYAPQLENSWNAISAVGMWISAILSGVAIWFAVFIPRHIAKSQNRIAIFEMRFASYSVFLKYTSFAEIIRQVNSPYQLRQALLSNFIEFGDNVDLQELILTIKNDEKKLMSGLFLFSNFCDGNMIHDILQEIFEIVCFVQCDKPQLSEEEKKKICSFCDKCQSFTDKYMQGMRQQLKIVDV